MENHNNRQGMNGAGIYMDNKVPEARVAPQAAVPPVVRDAVEYRMVYPEIYYKIQPYVVMMCDEMDVYGTTMPSQEMIEQMTDNIYNNICRIYPDMGECSSETVKEVQLGLSVYPYPYGYGYGRNRRGGFLGDLINILLLSEIFGRRRRRYYY